MTINKVRQIREKLFLSKAELAREAGVSSQTIHNVEKGSDCQLDTKRKIVLALGLAISDKEKIFLSE
ncbi:helix-turn-helix transcriptional regulator [Thermodesulfobacteriota bacterium]